MRRRLDQYFTPTSAVQALLAYGPPLSGTILEPCAGRGAIADPLRAVATVRTNDIDANMPVDCVYDACSAEFWAAQGPSDFVVSNPPFACCQPIIEQAYAHVRCGVIMLLRLSYLEPCNNRAAFLAAHPPALIVLPRISFTGDGKTDSVACAWMIWDKTGAFTRNRIVPKFASRTS